MRYRLFVLFLPAVLATTPVRAGDVLKGKDALGDWTTDAPGVRRKVTVDDLATPYATPSANNFPTTVPRPEGAPWSGEVESPGATNVSQLLSGMASRRSGRPARSPSTALAMSKPR